MAATAGKGRIGNFVNSVLGQGLSYNNEYSFYFDGKSGIYNILKRDYPEVFTFDYNTVGATTANAGAKLKVLCEEISLPGVSSATGQGRGIYQGVNFKYAHTKLYNDLSVSFLCDIDYTPLRFFEKWFHYVYEDDNINLSEDNILSDNRSYTTKYYYDYCMNMIIVKDEDKNGKRDVDGNKTNKSAAYTLVNAFPTSISSIPLNTGASQIVRFTVNLTYERWSMKVYNPKEEFKNKDTNPLLLKSTP